MSYILGIITGLLIAILIISLLTYYRRVIEHKVTIIEKMIESKGPRPKGFIIEPESEEDIARQEIIKRNSSQGRNTKFEELI